MHDGKELELDDTGIEFDNLDIAYLDAHRAAIEIWKDMAAQGRDASQYSFEITDGNGRHLLDLPFAELFRSRKPRARARLPALSSDRTVRSRVLAVEIADGIANVRRTVEQTRLVLQRSSEQESKDPCGD